MSMTGIATVYKGNIIKNLIMDCQSYTKEVTPEPEPKPTEPVDEVPEPEPEKKDSPFLSLLLIGAVVLAGGGMPKPVQSLNSIRRRSTAGNSLRSMRPTLNCTGLHKRKCALCWAGRSSPKWMC